MNQSTAKESDLSSLDRIKQAHEAGAIIPVPNPVFESVKDSLTPEEAKALGTIENHHLLLKEFRKLRRMDRCAACSRMIGNHSIPQLSACFKKVEKAVRRKQEMDSLALAQEYEQKRAQEAAQVAEEAFGSTDHEYCSCGAHVAAGQGHAEGCSA